MATSRRLLRSVHDLRHRQRIERVVSSFAIAFPEIIYDVLWPSVTRNAQAFIWDGRKSVRLYGGLARHKRISIAAIAWILAHETGHHFGGLPRDPHFPWISSDDGADHWAASVGLKKVFGPRLARRYAGFGRREADRIVFR
jgi:hypothetical protein